MKRVVLPAALLLVTSCGGEPQVPSAPTTPATTEPASPSPSPSPTPVVDPISFCTHLAELEDVLANVFEQDERILTDLMVGLRVDARLYEDIDSDMASLVGSLLSLGPKLCWLSGQSTV